MHAPAPAVSERSTTPPKRMRACRGQPCAGGWPWPAAMPWGPTCAACPCRCRLPTTGWTCWTTFCKLPCRSCPQTSDPHTAACWWLTQLHACRHPQLSCRHLQAGGYTADMCAAAQLAALACGNRVPCHAGSLMSAMFIDLQTSRTLACPSAAQRMLACPQANGVPSLPHSWTLRQRCTCNELIPMSRAAAVAGPPIFLLQEAAHQPRGCSTGWPRPSCHLQAVSAVAQQAGKGAPLRLELCCIGTASAADAALWTQLLSQQGLKPEEPSGAVLDIRVSSLAWPSQPHRCPLGSSSNNRGISCLSRIKPKPCAWKHGAVSQAD